MATLSVTSIMVTVQPTCRIIQISLIGIIETRLHSFNSYVTLSVFVGLISPDLYLVLH